MEHTLKRLLAASVAGSSVIIGCTAIASGLSLPRLADAADLPRVESPEGATATTPGISTPSASTASRTTPSQRIWADVPSVGLPVNGVGMDGDVHDWSFDEPSGTPPQHLRITVPAVSVPSVTVPAASVPSKTAEVTLPASARADTGSGTADADATAGGKSIEVGLR